MTEICCLEVAPASELLKPAPAHVRAILGGLPVDQFTFLFAQPGAEVSTPVTGAERAGAAQEIGRLLERMGKEAPALTQHPWECRFCGFKKVKWCEGVSFSSGDGAR